MTRRLASALVIVVLGTLGACGDPEDTAEPADTSTPPAAETTAAPTPASETVTMPPDAGGSTVATPATYPATTLPAAPEVGPCPDDPRVGETTNEDSERISQLQNEIEADVQAAVAYGATVPDEFTSAGFWNGDPVSIMVRFTDHLEAHRTALLPLIAHPDRLIVCAAPVSATEVERIQEELNAHPDREAITAHGFFEGRVVYVEVLPTRQDVAEELQSTYGDKLMLLVGAFPYPPPEPMPPAGCPPATNAIEPPSGVELALDAATIAIAGAERPRVTLTATNASDAPVEVGDVREVEVLGADGGFATVFVGGRTTEYRMNVVQPGASLTLDLDIPLASCDLAVGYAIPPGEYTMVAITQVGTATAPLTVMP